MEEEIRRVQLGDEIGLQAACFTAMTVEEVKSEVVMPALERALGTGHVVLVASVERRSSGPSRSVRAITD